MSKIKLYTIVSLIFVGVVFLKSISFKSWVDSSLNIFDKLYKVEFLFHDFQENIKIPVILYIDNQNKRFRLEAGDRIIVSDTITWKSLLKKNNQVFIQNVSINDKFYFNLFSKEYLVKSFLNQGLDKDLNSYNFYFEEINSLIKTSIDQKGMIKKIDVRNNENQYTIDNLFFSNDFNSKLIFNLEEESYIIFDLRDN